MKTITISIKNVYGKTLNYPVCKDAQTFAELIGTKTFTLGDLRKIESLGYKINIQEQKLAA